MGGGFILDIKRVAILTSGGDAPGMNAAVRAIVRFAISSGIEVLGIKKGFSGLINGDSFEMNLRTVSEIIHRGGTILSTARSPEFKTEEGISKAVNFCSDMKINCVIVIGGDGSFRGANELVKSGITCMCIPGTIDNDVACSEYTIGFDTAMNTAMEMIDKVRDTAQSHDRCNVVEVMGRSCGDIALYTGIAVGATSILIPEVKVDIEKDVVERIRFTQKIGKHHFIVIVSEGLKMANYVTENIQKITGIESRVTILGHVQRGGSPTIRDRVIASQMGCHLVDLLVKGTKNKVIILKNSKISDIDIEEAVKMKRGFDRELYEKALTISI